MPRVTVVIPAHNAGEFLGETLQAALASTFSDLAVIVVDDGSSDDTAAIAARFGPRVRVLSQANAGAASARNAGIAATDSEFIALLDSDDIWHPEKLRLQVASLDASATHAFSYTEFRSWSGGDWSTFAAEPRTGSIEPSLSGWIYHQFLLTNWAITSSLLFRRSAWKETGPFDCNAYQTEDWDYVIRASRRFQFLKLAEPLVLYRQHPASLSQRLAPTNTPEVLRDTLIARYGTKSPDGKEVDFDELRRRRYDGWRHFAAAHCARGKLSIGLRSFTSLLLRGPQRRRSLETLLKSLARRLVPKR